MGDNSMSAVFGSRLRTLRESRSLKQDDISSLFDMNKSAVSQWENGRIPHATILAKLAVFFNASIDYLLGLTDNTHGPRLHESTSTPPLNGRNLTDKANELMNNREQKNQIPPFELTNILRIENNLTYMNVELTRDDIVTIRHMIEMAMRTRLPKIIPIYPPRPPIDYSKIPRIEDIDPNSIPLPQEFMWADERINRHEILQAEGRLPTDDDWKHIVYNYKYHPPKE